MFINKKYVDSPTLVIVRVVESDRLGCLDQK
jgi:hypothetical protein